MNSGPSGITETCYSTVTSLAVFVLPLLVPRHLNCFEQLFVRLGRLPFEAFEIENPLVHVDEANRERVERVVALEERLSDLAAVGPDHNSPPKRCPSLRP